jgi:hypothetical protein
MTRSRWIGLVLGLVIGPVLFAVGPPAAAGPTQARERWKEAQAQKGAPWRARVAALRAVRSEASDTDSILPRSLAAEADVLRAAGFPSAAAAAEAYAASLGSRRDPDRLARALSAARALLADEDVTGALPLLEEVLEHAGAATPFVTGPAIECMATLRADRDDLRAVEALVRRAGREVPREFKTRLVLLDRLGCLLLDRDDEAGGRRCLAEATRVLDEASRAGGIAARAASRAWLDLRLAKRLP